MNGYLRGAAVALLACSLYVSPVMAKDADTTIVWDTDFKVADLRVDHLMDEYRLAKYDTIGISIIGFENTVFDSTNTSVDSLMIGPDGYVQIPYAGNVKLAGLSLAEANKLLSEELGKYLKFPSLSVAVKQYGARKVYVTGAVMLPGIKDMAIDTMNVYAAVSEAGGVTNRGRSKHVQVLRPIGDTMYYREVNIDAFVKKHDMTQNLALEDGDIVYVPESNKIVFSEDIAPYINVYATYKALTND